jgi:dihydrofolate reductase
VDPGFASGRRDGHGAGHAFGRSALCTGASGTLIRFLLAERLLDELILLVHPVVIGVGQRLFGAGSQTAPLTLVESRPHRNDVVALRYAPAQGS